jgi:hypothetical protein
MTFVEAESMWGYEGIRIQASLHISHTIIFLHSFHEPFLSMKSVKLSFLIQSCGNMIITTNAI